MCSSEATARTVRPPAEAEKEHKVARLVPAHEEHVRVADVVGSP
jgi:hypothetical protein